MKKKEVLFVFDETAVLGRLDAIDTAIGIGRGYGVRCQFYFQSMGQIQTCFPDGRDQTLLSNVTQVYFGINDYSTAEAVSNRLGDETIVLQSGGTNGSTSWQSNDGANPSVSRSDSSGWSRSWNFQARKLLKPEELMTLPPGIALTFTPGVRPVCTELIRYHDEKRLLTEARGKTAQNERPWVSVAKSLYVLAVFLALAAVLTHTLVKKSERHSSLPAKKEWVSPNAIPHSGADHEQDRTP
ncbi:MAG: TraG/TraD/VirD4 family protein [Tepidisphaeraceae bacterium]